MKRIIVEEDYKQPELPHILSGLFERIYEDLIDWDNLKDANNVNVGESYMAPYAGQVILYRSTETENLASFSHLTTRMEMKEPKPQKVAYAGYAIYTIINLPKIHKMPWGWRSECFRPQVKDGDKWREASNNECKHWDEIPKDKHRIIYCLGVLGDDENTA